MDREEWQRERRELWQRPSFGITIELGNRNDVLFAILRGPFIEHSPSPINMGENFVKSIYEAVRNSPQWNETLFILTWL
jgi:hypothetical protein